MPSCDQRDCACTVYVDPMTGRQISEEELAEIRKSRQYLEFERQRIEKEEEQRREEEIKRLTAERKKIDARLAQLTGKQQ